MPRGRLLASCVRALEAPSVAGLHLDIEGFGEAHASAIAGFRDWLGALDEIRRTLGKNLSAFFPASDEFSPYDPSGAKRIDYWVAQLYDAHWVDSKVTGPLVTRASENPVAVQRALARIAALDIPSGNVLLSVPLYGWEWPSESENLAHIAGSAFAGQWQQHGASLMIGPTGGQIVGSVNPCSSGASLSACTATTVLSLSLSIDQGWYEDLPSLMRKLTPERTQGYAGLAFFPLGYDKGEVIEAMLRWWRSAPN